MSEIISSGSRTGTFFALILRNRTKLANSAKKLIFAKNGTEAEILEKVCFEKKKGSNKKSSEQKINSGFDFHGFYYDSGCVFQELTRQNRHFSGKNHFS